MAAESAAPCRRTRTTASLQRGRCSMAAESHRRLLHPRQPSGPFNEAAARWQRRAHWKYASKLTWYPFNEAAARWQRRGALDAGRRRGRGPSTRPLLDGSGEGGAEFLHDLIAIDTRLRAPPFQTGRRPSHTATLGAHGTTLRNDLHILHRREGLPVPAQHVGARAGAREKWMMLFSCHRTSSQRRACVDNNYTARGSRGESRLSHGA